MSQLEQRTVAEVMRSQFLREMHTCITEGAFEAPRLPQLAQEVLALADDPDASMKKIAVLLARDPGLAARVLHLANSAAFCGREPIAKLSQAMARVGLTNLKQLLVAYAMKGKIFKADHWTREMKDLWQHSVAAAVCTDLIARKVGIKDERAFLAGLLHDIGRPVALHVAIDIMAEIPELAVTPREEVMWMTDRVHSHLGQVIANRWGLPEEYRVVMAHHHDDPLYEGIADSLVHMVALADTVCANLGLGYPLDRDPEAWDTVAAQQLGLDEPKLKVIEAQLFDRADAFLID